MTKKKPAARKCSAKSKQSGKPCKQPAIPGGTVCRFHGGSAPQVIRSAKERLAALVDPAIARLAKLLKSKKDVAAYRAVKDVLDRNGFKPKDEVELAGKNGGPIRFVVERIAAGAPKENENA